MVDKIEVVIDKVLERLKLKTGPIILTPESFTDLLNSGNIQYHELNNEVKEGRGFYHDLVYRDTRFRTFTISRKISEL